jgi:hypothetical protein
MKRLRRLDIGWWFILAGLLILLASHFLRAQTATGAIADEEELKGLLNGVNDTFTIVRAPIPWISLKVYRNGIRMRRCRDGVPGICDYTLLAPYNKLVFIPGNLPLAGDLLIADYRY